MLTLKVLIEVSYLLEEKPVERLCQIPKPTILYPLCEAKVKVFNNLFVHSFVRLFVLFAKRLYSYERNTLCDKHLYHVKYFMKYFKYFVLTCKVIFNEFILHVKFFLIVGEPQ